MMLIESFKGVFWVFLSDFFLTELPVRNVVA